MRDSWYYGRHPVLHGTSIELLEQRQREIERLRAALIAERDDAMTWDGIGTVNRINAVLAVNKEVSPPIDYKARYEALVQGLRDGYRPGESAYGLISWLESTTGFTMHDEGGEVSTDVRR
jgi:hypothetical protein